MFNIKYFHYYGILDLVSYALNTLTYMESYKVHTCTFFSIVKKLYFNPVLVHCFMKSDNH